MRDAINAALKQAMLQRDAARLSALRMVSAAIANADIEARGQGREAIGEAALVSLLGKLVKQRQDAAELYDKGGRAELAAKERAEIAVIREFLPEQMGEDEMRAAVAAAIRETGASSVKDMGKVMGALKAAHGGKMDFGRAGGLVKEMLGQSAAG